MSIKRRLQAIEQPRADAHLTELEAKRREASAYLAQHPDLALCEREDFGDSWECGYAYVFLLILRARAKGDHAMATICAAFQRRRQSMDDGGPDVPKARIAELLDGAARVARDRVRRARSATSTTSKTHTERTRHATEQQTLEAGEEHTR